VIHRTDVTVENALRFQNADQDADFAECLRHGVSVPIWDQSAKAHALAKRLCRVREAS
jgi:hypothetical protein